MSFGFQHYHGKAFKSWQIMFLVIGLFTIFVGVLVVLFLPDNPMSSRLTHNEKIVAVERLRENNTGLVMLPYKSAPSCEPLTKRLQYRKQTLQTISSPRMSRGSPSISALLHYGRC